MNIRNVMTKDPVCCTSEMSVADVAELLFTHDCGSIPVVDDLDERKPLGMVTDRDITCRCVAKGLDAARTPIRECMSLPALTISEKASLDSCEQAMAVNQIRRMIVVNSEGRVSGVVAQADVARSAGDKEAGSVLKRISQPAMLAAGH